MLFFQGSVALPQISKLTIYVWGLMCSIVASAFTKKRGLADVLHVWGHVCREGGKRHVQKWR